MQRGVLETAFLWTGLGKSKTKLVQAGNGATRPKGAAVQVPMCPFVYRKQLIFSVRLCHP